MIDRLWLQLLALKNKLASLEVPLVYCHVSGTKGIVFNEKIEEITTPSFFVHWKKIEVQAPSGSTELLLQPDRFPQLLNRGALGEEAIEFLLLYLPYCFLQISAKENNKAQVVAHFAQTLDGKIATLSGSSRWIGNRENLMHAHRMRALCDGVLIGKGTLRVDDPQLTVRHVSGQNPLRIIIGNTFQSFGYKMNPKDGNIWIIGQSCCSLPQGMKFIPMKHKNGKIPEAELLAALFKMGVKTIYLEGGPSTTSRFLETGNIDLLQLHLSPMIFGSGVAAIELPKIDHLSERIRFKASKFIPIGDAIMFIGYL